MIQTIRHRYFAFGVALVLVLALVGCGGGLQGKANSDLQQPAGDTAGNNGTASSPAEDALMAAVASALGDTVKLAFVPVPTDFVANGQSGRWLEITVPSESTSDDPSPEDVIAGAKGEWLGALALGSYRDSASIAGLPDVQGVTFRAGDAPLDSGAVQFEPGTADAPPGQPTKLLRDRTELAGRAEAAASSADLTVETLDFQDDGLGPALVMSMMTADPKAALENREWLSAIVGAGSYSIEGWFIVLTDSSGAPFYMSAVSSRGGRGQAWVRPDLESALTEGGGIGSAQDVSVPDTTTPTG